MSLFQWSFDWYFEVVSWAFLLSAWTFHIPPLASSHRVHISATPEESHDRIFAPGPPLAGPVFARKTDHGQ